MPTFSPDQPVIRTLNENDLPAAMRLTEIASWNQTSLDWHRFLSANPPGNYAAVCGGEVMGTAATIRYNNKIAWIGMVLVDPNFRRRGIGQQLLEAALQGLSDVPCVKLDATPDGKKLYDTLGFEDEDNLQRWTCPRLDLAMPKSTFEVRRATSHDFDTLVNLDAQPFGAARPLLLKSLLDSPLPAWCAWRGGKIVGFCLSREGTRFTQIGPVIAEDIVAARDVTAAALHELRGRAIVIDIPNMQSSFTDWLQELGFSCQRPFIRMFYGEKCVGDQPTHSFAICGPEFG